MATQRKRILSLLFAAMLCSLWIVFPVRAEETQSSKTEIVFLLDTSVSMKKQDSNYLAVDAIKQMIYSLPSSYKSGIVTYGTQAETVIPLGIDSLEIEEKLAAVSYSGYTNAGAGLEQAVDLFSDDDSIEQYIIMLSDGEIDMPDDQARRNSRQLYAEAAKRAKEKNITIYIVAIGTELTPALHVFDGAELTNGAIYWQGYSGALSNIMERIVSERLKYPINKMEISGNGQLQVNMPKGASRMKVVLSGGGIDSVSADNGSVITGKEFSVVTIDRLAAPVVNIQLQSSEPDKLHAYYFTEYYAHPQISVIEHTAEATQLRIELITDGPDAYNLWQNAEYEGKTISYRINGAEYTGVIKDGVIQESIPFHGAEKLEFSLDPIINTKAIHHLNPADAMITLPVIEVSEPEEPIKTLDYRPLCIILAVLAVAVVAIALYCSHKRAQKAAYAPSLPVTSPRMLQITSKQPQAASRSSQASARPPQAPARSPRPAPQAVPASYSGKLDIYAVKMPENQHIPPQTFRLFGKSAEWMTLTQILEPCGIHPGRSKTDRIQFFPGPEHALIVMDHSYQCTVYRDMEILQKGVEYPVSYQSKITVSIDAETVVEIYYRSLKLQINEED